MPRIAKDDGPRTTWFGSLDVTTSKTDATKLVLHYNSGNQYRLPLEAGDVDWLISKLRKLRKELPS